MAETVILRPRDDLAGVIAAVSDDPGARLLLERSDGRLTVVAASDAVESLLEVDPVQLVDRPVDTLVASGAAHALLDAIDVVLARPGRRRCRSVEVTAAHAARTRLQWTLTALSRVGGDLVLVELSEPADVHAHAPLFDPVTGAASRELFVDRVAHALSRTRRTETLVAVMALDIDNTVVADDHVPEAFARIVRRNLRGGDTLARVGPTRFMVLLEDVDAPASASIPAERILEAFRRPIRIETDLVQLPVSIGLVVSGGGVAAWPDGLMRDADRALAEAAAARDGRPHTPSPAPAPVTGSREDLVAQLTDPLAEHRIEPYYQYVVLLPDREPIAVEALMRWHHPHAGTLEAREFLQAAVANDVIALLGARVRTEALRATGSWLAEDPQRYLSINLSDAELHTPGLRATLIDNVDAAGVDRSQLALEIGEATFMNASGTRTRVLRELHDAGFPIIIDGYGEEHSSYRHFEDFPVDAVKISGRLTAGIGRTPASERVLLGILAMLHFLEIQIVATAVETPAQLAFYETHGCQLAQGYLFHPPVPENGLADAALDLQEAGAVWLPPVVLEERDRPARRLGRKVPTVEDPFP